MKCARLFLAASALLVAVAVTPAQDRPTRVPGIDASGMDLTVRPQDDFCRTRVRATLLIVHTSKRITSLGTTIAKHCSPVAILRRSQPRIAAFIA